MIGDLVSAKRDWVWYLAGVALTPLLLTRLGLTTAQTLAVGGFCVVLYGAIFFWRQRLAFACFGIAGLLAADSSISPTSSNSMVGHADGRDTHGECEAGAAIADASMSAGRVCYVS